MYKTASSSRSFSQEELWVTKHAPTSLSDLAVHKKKVEEVFAWFKQNLYGGHKNAAILLLVGPTGVGKTITLHVVAKELNVEVVEWINPLTEASFDPGTRLFRDDDMRQPDFYRESQMSKFTEFLLRTNRYPSLAIFGNETFKRKILLVEDFPNAVLQEQKNFHELLRSYRRKGAGPLVFIVSDGDGVSAGERILFPPDVQTSLQIEMVRFNPIAPTSMAKVLSKIAATESRQSPSYVQVPNAEIINQLVISSAGDVRSAINSLQFFCLNSFKIPSLKTKAVSAAVSSSRKRTHSSATKSNFKTAAPSDNETSIGLRDTNLSLFRALGKILYCKRDDKLKTEECVVLPNHLALHCRDPLAMVPEDVVEKSHISADGFTTFLHQNYLDFYTSLNDINLASEYLSDADYLTREWSSRTILQQYSSSVATRGLLFCNTSRATVSLTASAGGLGWKPLHKPQWFNVMKKSREYSESLQSQFADVQLSAIELVTQVFPFMSIIGTSHLTRGQAAVVKEIGTFTKFMARNLPEKFDEKDFVLSEENDDDIRDREQSTKDQSNLLPNSSNNEQTSELQENSLQLLIAHDSDLDENLNIEEFED